jgi:DNA modification methylase
VPQLYPGKRHPERKGKDKKPSGNPLGKNPSDYWEFSAIDYFRDNPVWEIPNVKANHPEKTIHPCQFPTELVERCVLALTAPGDSVLDPFVGTGTSVIAALKHGRNAIGIDKEASFIKLANERATKFLAGKLKLRPSGKPTMNPRLGDKVAKIPEEWIK